MFLLTEEKIEQVDSLVPRQVLPDNLLEAMLIGRKLDIKIRNEIVKAQLKMVVEELDTECLDHEHNLPTLRVECSECVDILHKEAGLE